MKFPYRKYPNRAPNAICPDASIRVPIIPLRVLTTPDRYLDTYALVDSGAQLCLFPAEYARYLGLDPAHGIAIPVHGIGGATLSALFQPVTLEVGGWGYQAPVGFAESGVPVPLLGQIGFFDHARVIFDYTNEKIEILPHRTTGKA